MAGDLFVGRGQVIATFEAEVASLGRGARPREGSAAAAPHHVFVLTGVSGIGKSELAGHLLGHIPDGIAKGLVRVQKDWGYGPEPDAAISFIERLAQGVEDQSGNGLRNFAAARQVYARALATVGQHRAEHPEEWQQAEDRARAEDATAKGA